MLNEQEMLFQHLAREWVRDNLFESGYRWDMEGELPPVLRDDLRKIGLWGMSLPEQYGGGGASTAETAVVAAELAFGLPAFHLSWSANNALAGYPIARFGSESQRQKHLPAMARGAAIGCYALTEPGAGSDAAGIEMIARFNPENSSWTLRGTKLFITNAHEASIGVVFAKVSPDDAECYAREVIGGRSRVLPKDHRAWARRDAGMTAFVVGSTRANSPLLYKRRGVSVRVIPKWPMPSCPYAEVFFDDVEIGSDTVLGDVGGGFYVAMETLNNGRINIAAQAVGIARRALYEAERYGSRRNVFNETTRSVKPLITIRKQARRLQRLTAKTAKAWELTIEAARAKDAGCDYRVRAARAKLAATETAKQCADFNLLLHGGMGAAKETICWQVYHDAQVTTIYEGASDIQRMVMERGIKR